MPPTETADPAAPDSARKPPHAEFMQIWEEGYVNRQIPFENMQIPGLFIADGAGLRGADGAINRPRVVAYIDAMMASNPSFRLRLQRSALGLTPPAWVPDEDFDLLRHIHFADEEVDLEAVDLRTIAGAYDGTLSIRHPLWRVRITPLTNGDVAIGTLMHHASLDGMSAMQIASGMTQQSPDAPLPDVVDPFGGVRAARAFELPGLALRQWRARQPNIRTASRAYWSKPLIGRARRVAARLLVPFRYGRGAESARTRLLPPIHSAYRTLDAGAVRQRAHGMGGTTSDLLMSAVIGAWDGDERIVRLRIPVSFHSPDAPNVRNHVRDMEISGNSDADLATIVAAVHDQVARRTAETFTEAVPGSPIGYATLLRWLSRPAYFCGGEVYALIPFPASLGSDQLAVVGVIYNGALFIGGNMPRSRDVEKTIGRVCELMMGTEDPGRR